MIEVVVLGTACMQPTKERNHVGILLKYGKENILFDCGENIQRQLKKVGFKPAKITKIFISHWHGDHVLGLPGLMCTMGADQFEGKLEIYGPRGTKKHLDYMLKAFLSKRVIEHEVKEIGSGRLEFSNFYIESKRLEHGVNCLGYSFIEKDRRRIKPQYIKKIPGVLLGKLQKGKKVVHQGKKYTPETTTYLIKGKKITMVMDTRPCDNLVLLAQDADLLISEATYLERDKDKAEEYAHLTAQEAGLLANQAEVKRLVLLHFSQRYKDFGEIREEAEKVFKKVVCAEDLMKFKV